MRVMGYGTYLRRGERSEERGGDTRLEGGHMKVIEMSEWEKG